jgi:nucleoside-diphosphate-sugar epimerase
VAVSVWEESSVSKQIVVVTGASGFVGKYVTADVIRAGYRVRGTIRDLGKAEPLRGVIDELVGRPVRDDLELVAADLLDDAGWPEIMTGAAAVMHVATTILRDEPTDPDLVIRPAVEGTERVLRFAHAAGVKRIIITSSVASVGYGLGHTSGKRVYTEADFTQFETMERPWAYCVGKTKAERRAWEFARSHGLELTTIHPGAILGPASDPSTSISLGMVTNLLSGRTQAVINTGFSIIDVRDVAALHLAALQNPESIGERYLATDSYTRFEQVANILRQHYPDYPITDRVLPDEVLLGMLKAGTSASQIVNDLGNEKHYDGSKGMALLGRPFIPAEQAILSAAESAIRLGLVSPPQQPA